MIDIYDPKAMIFLIIILIIFPAYKYWFRKEHDHKKRRRSLVFLIISWLIAIGYFWSMVFFTKGQKYTARECYEVNLNEAKIWQKDVQLSGIYGYCYGLTGSEKSGTAPIWFYYFTSDSEPVRASTIGSRTANKSGKLKTWGRKRVEDHWRKLHPLPKEWIDSDIATTVALEYLQVENDQSLRFKSYELFKVHDRTVWKVTMSRNGESDSFWVFVDAVSGKVLPDFH